MDRSISDGVLSLLEGWGVTGATDDPLLPYLISSVTERVKNETNQKEVPEGLYHVTVELAAGEYLAFRKNAGKLEIEGLDLEAAVKQIQEGDTTVTYAVGEGSMTPEQRLDVLISRLTRDRSREFVRYRRLVW